MEESTSTVDSEENGQELNTQIENEENKNNLVTIVIAVAIVVIGVLIALKAKRK